MTKGERKKTPWWLWTSAVLLLPLLYVAGFGPACWGVVHGILPIGPTALVYDPILRISASQSVEWGQEPTQNWLYRYGWRYSEVPDADPSGIEILAGERGFRGGGQFGVSGEPPMGFWESSWDWLTRTAD